MKVFVALFFVAISMVAAADKTDMKDSIVASSYGGSSSYSAPPAPSYSAPSYSAPAAPSYSAPAAPSYSAPISVPAPPCPKNYVISCQPNVRPVPCSPQSSSYGSVGSYSQYVPQYVMPNNFEY